MKTVYLAAPWFTEHQAKVQRGMRVELGMLGFKVFDPRSESEGIWAGRPPAQCSDEDRRKVLNMNMMGMAQAGLVVAWLGGEKPDLGVAWELGFIYGAGSLSSPPYTIAFIHDEDPRQDLNLMLAMTVDWLARGVRELDQLLEDYLSVGPMDRWNAASRADHEGAT